MPLRLAATLSILARQRYFLPLALPRTARIQRSCSSYGAVTPSALGGASLRRGLGLVWGRWLGSQTLLARGGAKVYYRGFDLELFQLKSRWALANDSTHGYPSPREWGGGVRGWVAGGYVREFGTYGTRVPPASLGWAPYFTLCVGWGTAYSAGARELTTLSWVDRRGGWGSYTSSPLGWVWVVACRQVVGARLSWQGGWGVGEGYLSLPRGGGGLDEQTPPLLWTDSYDAPALFHTQVEEWVEGGLGVEGGYPRILYPHRLVQAQWSAGPGAETTVWSAPLGAAMVELVCLLNRSAGPLAPCGIVVDLVRAQILMGLLVALPVA